MVVVTVYGAAHCPNMPHGWATGFHQLPRDIRGSAAMVEARRKILCIEDDRETAQLIGEELTERGFDVVIAHDGQEGFVAILKGIPDLVLCDLGLPVMTGFELLERLIEIAPRFVFPVEKVAVGSIDFNEELTVQVFTPCQGKIIDVFAKVGDEVKAGQTLFVIDSPDLLAADSALVAAAGVLELTSRNLERLKVLYQSRAVSQHDLEQAVSDQQTAEGALRSARDAVRIFGKSQQEVNRIVADRMADPRLIMPSPISGRVTGRNAAPGLLVQASETLPRTDATDSSGAGGPILATPPRVVAPDNSPAASLMRAPIDTSIASTRSRGLLPSAKGRPLFGPVPALPFKPAPLLAAPKDRNDLLSRKPSPVAGLALSIPLPAAPAASHGNAQGLARKPAMGADGILLRNAIGVVIGQRTVVPQAGAPLGIHPLPGAAVAGVSGEHGPATTAVGAPLAATTPKPGDGGVSARAADTRQAGHPDQALRASHIASIGGPAVGRTPVFRPAYSTGALGGSAKAVAGGISGANVRTRHP
jgi:CheY-like chemotaxis protein